MRVRSKSGEPLFNFPVIPVEEIGSYSGAIEDIYEKRLDGMIIRGVLPQAAVDAAVRALDVGATEAGAMERRTFAVYADRAEPAYTVGQAIVGADPSLEGYFADAEAQRGRIRAMFGGQVDLEARLAEIFSVLAGGRSAGVAPGPEGRTCPPATVRVLPEGTEIGVHVGNEFIRLPQADHLRKIVDMTDQVSFFIPLSTPERGGQLIVYGIEWKDIQSLLPTTDSAHSNVWYEGTAVFEAFAAMDGEAFDPQPGDLLIFDGGRYFHRVAKTEGRRPRRTIGGFLGFSQGRERVYFWS